MNMSDDKESDERYHISKNYEERVTDDVEVLKQGNLFQRKMMTILRNNMLKEIEWI